MPGLTRNLIVIVCRFAELWYLSRSLKNVRGSKYHPFSYAYPGISLFRQIAARLPSLEGAGKQLSLRHRP